MKGIFSQPCRDIANRLLHFRENQRSSRERLSSGFSLKPSIAIFISTKRASLQTLLAKCFHSSNRRRSRSICRSSVTQEARASLIASVQYSASTSIGSMTFPLDFDILSQRLWTSLGTSFFAKSYALRSS
ncbi:hypothetical protein ACTFIW_003739 [Dictyostelium discoideum]